MGSVGDRAARKGGHSGPTCGTMSPGSGVKSEYMKRYQEPRWDEYGPCYRALRHYCLGRRLLEQAHAPWLWDHWGQAGASDDSASSASSGTGAPAPQCAPASPLPPPAEPEARVGPEERGVATPRTLARQTPLSMGFSRRENWTGLLPFPSPETFPTQD